MGVFRRIIPVTYRRVMGDIKSIQKQRFKLKLAIEKIRENEDTTKEEADVLVGPLIAQRNILDIDAQTIGYSSGSLFFQDTEILEKPIPVGAFQSRFESMSADLEFTTVNVDDGLFSHELREEFITLKKYLDDTFYKFKELSLRRNKRVDLVHSLPLNSKFSNGIKKHQKKVDDLNWEYVVQKGKDFRTLTEDDIRLIGNNFLADIYEFYINNLTQESSNGSTFHEIIKSAFVLKSGIERILLNAFEDNYNKPIIAEKSLNDNQFYYERGNYPSPVDGMIIQYFKNIEDSGLIAIVGTGLLPKSPAFAKDVVTK